MEEGRTPAARCAHSMPISSAASYVFSFVFTGGSAFGCGSACFTIHIHEDGRSFKGRPSRAGRLPEWTWHSYSCFGY